jgi:signal peptidase I
MSIFSKDKVTFTEDGGKFSTRLWHYFGEMLQIALVVTAIVLPIRYFLIQPFYVEGASMEPNFEDHEYLIIDEITYRLREPVRGEIAVFRYPNNPSLFFIKRIVGLPGETIKLENGTITIKTADNEKIILDEKEYLPTETITAGEKNITLGDDEFFVLGDNRSNSLDSRVFGPVPRKNVVGRVVLRGWPLNKISLFKNPEYKR